MYIVQYTYITINSATPLSITLISNFYLKQNQAKMYRLRNKEIGWT